MIFNLDGTKIHRGGSTYFDTSTVIQKNGIDMIPVKMKEGLRLSTGCYMETIISPTDLMVYTNKPFTVEFKKNVLPANCTAYIHFVYSKNDDGWTNLNLKITNHSDIKSAYIRRGTIIGYITSIDGKFNYEEPEIKCGVRRNYVYEI